jgi:hypothetical protein
MEFKETKTEERTPAAVPNNEKLISPLIPRTNPMIIITKVPHAYILVLLPNKK